MGSRLSVAASLVSIVVAFGCAIGPGKPDGGADGATTESESGTPPHDLATSGDGDGDGDPSTSSGDGDGDPTTTSGDGDGDEPLCGNGVVDNGEQCDGDNLNGFTCIDLGYASGTLVCDPIVCTFDASGCMIGPADEMGGTGD